jgi:hypothetical protein
MPLLVNTPAAQEFLGLLHTESGLNSILGVPDHADEYVRPAMLTARFALEGAAKTVTALASDPTRTEVDKHQAAKKVADSVTAKLEAARVALTERADYLTREAMREADRHLGPKVERGALQSEIRSWVREMAKTSDGLPKIRAAMKASPDAAAVIWHSPSFLAGLPPNIHEELRFEALEASRPDLYAQLSSAASLEHVADKMQRAARRVHSTFYSHAIADQANKRVEVP